MDNLKLIIAQKLVALRKGNSMTQIELAEKLDYSDKAISKWERGESLPSVVVLKRIADVFGVTVDYFIYDVHDEKSDNIPMADVIRQDGAVKTGKNERTKKPNAIKSLFAIIGKK